MIPNEKFGIIPSDGIIEKTTKALNENGIRATMVDNGATAKRKVFELLPEGVEVMNMTSRTLETIGVAEEIMKSGRYNSVRQKLMSMDRSVQNLEMQKMGAAPEWVIGSVHAITKDGKLLIASNTGSQLPAYAYGSSHVIFVAGAQKIVKDFDEGLKRIYEYALPLEDERAKKVYGRGSAVNKILVINKELIPDRITLFIVKEKLGF